MASCKDCLSCKVCYRTQVEGIPECTEIRDCPHFEDRNRFAELPCKVGDKVYYFFSDSNYKKYEVCEIVGFHIDKYRTAFQIELCGYKILVDTEFLGEKIFLTHEEAEQALKERENNS